MAHSMQGIIAIWSGSVDSIPFGWKLCDGNNGTPNLSGRFVRGHEPPHPTGTTGGSDSHVHTATQPPHYHTLKGGEPTNSMQEGTDYYRTTYTATPEITVQSADSMPAFYSLCYIMHI
ncbi:MAG: hypothetical protein U9N44_00800 [Chloroflexota bacterium]|nr:hypothetical protein [Chloroflexota bacterium]